MFKICSGTNLPDDSFGHKFPGSHSYRTKKPQRSALIPYRLRPLLIEAVLKLDLCLQPKLSPMGLYLLCLESRVLSGQCSLECLSGLLHMAAEELIQPIRIITKLFLDIL